MNKQRIPIFLYNSLKIVYIGRYNNLLMQSFLFRKYDIKKYKKKRKNCRMGNRILMKRYVLLMFCFFSFLIVPKQVEAKNPVTMKVEVGWNRAYKSELIPVKVSISSSIRCKVNFEWQRRVITPKREM